MLVTSLRRRHRPDNLTDRPPCTTCKKRPQMPNADCGGRCELCWAIAATYWVWHGERINAFHHRRR